MNKKIISVALALLMLFATAGCNNESKSATPSATPAGTTETVKSPDGKYDLTGVKPITLRVSSSLPVTHTCWVGYYVPWMDQVTKETNGLVKFEVYKAGELVESGKEYDGLTQGVIDIAAPLLVTYDPGRFPMSDIPLLPLKKSDAQIATKAIDLMLKSTTVLKDGKTFNDLEYGANGLFVMTHNEASASVFNTAKKEISSPADIKGLRMRTSNRVHQLFAESLGCIPVSMPSTDCYDAMSRGALDGLFNQLADWPTYGFDNLLKYSIQGLNLGHFVAFMTMTNEKWNGLPKVVQQIFTDTSEAIMLQGAKMWDDSDASVLNEATANGTKFVNFADLPNDVQTALNNAAAGVWGSYIEMQESAGHPGKAAVKLWRDCVVQAGGQVPDGVDELLK